MRDRTSVRISVRTLAGAAVLVLSITAATPARSQRLSIHNYTPETGLVGAPVWNIFQDHRGIIWFATEEGVSSYDGVSFRNITFADGLPSATVEAILRANDGSLWFGTPKGMARYDGIRLTRITPPLGRMASRLDAHGNLWGGDSGGISRFDGKEIRTFRDPPALRDEEVYSVTPLGSSVWIGRRTSGVVEMRMDGTRLIEVRTYRPSDGLAHPTVRAIARDREGRMYFGTRGGGVTRFDGRSFQTFDTRHGLPSNDVYSMLVTRSNDLVIGTVDNGLAICDLPEFQRCRSISVGNGLLGRTVFSLFEDREGNIWIGLTNGVSKLMSLHAESYTEQEGLPSDHVYVVRDEGSDVWIGTIGGLARKTSNGVWEVYRAGNGLPSSEVRDVIRDGAGRLWIGTARGLCVTTDPRTGFECLTQTDGVGDYVLDLALSRSGDVLMGSSGGVYSRIRFVAGTPLRVSGRSMGTGINSVAEDRRGRVWLGSGGRGVFAVTEQEIRQFTTAEGLANDDTLALHVDSRDGVWVGHHGAGVSYLAPGATRFRSLTKVAALKTASVASIIDDGRGRLWLGTNRGVMKIDPAGIDNPSVPLLLDELDETDGFISRIVAGPNALTVDDSGNLWAGFIRGVTHYAPGQRTVSTIAPHAMVVGATVDGQKLDAPFTTVASGEATSRWPASFPLRLDHEQNNVRFDFRGLAFRDERDVRFRVRLDGFDDQWSPLTSVPFKEYTNLAPGRYVFRVTAVNGDGVPSASPAAFAFVIVPPFWQTTSFRFFSIALLVALTLSTYMLRTGAIRRRNVALERLVNERTRELQRANEEIVRADMLKDKFLASVSHELRTPLNAIIGFSEVLLTRAGKLPPEKLRKFHHNVHVAGHHLLNLINNILDMSKIEAGKMEVTAEQFSLPDLMQEIGALLRAIADPKSVVIDVDVDDHLSQVVLDPAKVRQIVLNLASNAIKFSAPRQIVTISVRRLLAADSLLGVESLEIAVTDRGPGISQDELSKLFSEFAQTSSARAHLQGTGLGLALVKQFAEMQGGTVAVTSSVGEGSTFRVVLPMRIGIAERASSPAS